MNEVAMNLGDRVRLLRGTHGLTQLDLASKSGVSLTTVQRIERGNAVSADTVSSLAAAFNIPAAQLSNFDSLEGHEPYLPLESIMTGRDLASLLRFAGRLDFDFDELDDLKDAEIVEELQSWCRSMLGSKMPDAAVERARAELAATEILQRLRRRNFEAAGATYGITINEVDDEFGSTPILLCQWEETCAVIRVGRRIFGNRAFVLGNLGKWESPSGDALIYPEAQKDPPRE